MKRNKQSRTHKPPDPAKFAPQASGGDLTLQSRSIGVLPIRGASQWAVWGQGDRWLAPGVKKIRIARLGKMR